MDMELGPSLRHGDPEAEVLGFRSESVQILSYYKTSIF